MKTALVILCLAGVALAQDNLATDMPTTPGNHTHHHHENPEKESFSFNYDSTSQSMVVLKGNLCYIFSVTDQEKSSVHTDSGLRAIEVRILNDIDSAFYTVLPGRIISTHIVRYCGKTATSFYLVH